MCVYIHPYNCYCTASTNNCFLRIWLFYFTCRVFVCMCVSTPCTCSAHGGQHSVLDFLLGLHLQTKHQVGLGTQPRSSARTASTLYYRAISLAPQILDSGKTDVIDSLKKYLQGIMLHINRTSHWFSL